MASGSERWTRTELRTVCFCGSYAEALTHGDERIRCLLVRTDNLKRAGFVGIRKHTSRHEGTAPHTLDLSQCCRWTDPLAVRGRYG